MIMFDIQIKSKEQHDILSDPSISDIATFEPDITSLVTFRGGNR